MVAVPLAPGTLRTPMNPDAPVPTAGERAVDAAPFILDAAGRPTEGGVAWVGPAALAAAAAGEERYE